MPDPAPARPRLAPLAAAAVLLAATMLAAPTASAARFDEDLLRDDLQRLRADLEDAVARYEAAYANWTAAEDAGDAAAKADARDAMVEAGRDVGDHFLEFERGHGNESSLSAFMRERMPPRFYQAFERHMVLLRSTMLQADGGAPAPPSEVQAQEHLVTQALDRAGSCMPDGCRGNLVGTTAQAFLILLREGFEAILVVGAMVAYLRKSNRGEKARLVYAGVAGGVVASLLAWVGLRSVFDAARPGSVQQTMLEATSMLLAAAVLFYVSFWLLSKVETRRWQAYLDGKIQDSLASDRAWLLGAIGFLAVFREGVETALFLQALSTRSGGGATFEILLGLGLAAGVLVLVYHGVHTLGVKVPLRPFFIGTSALLYALAVRFAGLGVFELQEGSLIPVTPLPNVVQLLTQHPILATLLQDVGGFAPTLEVLLTQAVMVLVIVLGGVWSWTRQGSPEAASG